MQMWKQPKCPSVDEIVNIHTHIHTHTYIHTCLHIPRMEYCSTIKMNGILPFATTWMDVEGFMLSEVNHTKKLYCHIHGGT